MDAVEAGQTRVVVSDAGPLIHLHRLECVSLLTFPEILVPEKVWQEVERHQPLALTNSPVPWIRVETIRLTEEILKLCEVFKLDAGEIAAIQTVRERNAELLLCDDAAARLAATSMGIAVTGTIGILLRALRENLRTRAEVLETLRSLPSRCSLHLKRSLLDDIIRRVETHKS